LYTVYIKRRLLRRRELESVGEQGREMGTAGMGREERRTWLKGEGGHP
jgi:hypothetical protein